MKIVRRVLLWIVGQTVCRILGHAEETEVICRFRIGDVISYPFIRDKKDRLYALGHLPIYESLSYCPRCKEKPGPTKVPGISEDEQRKLLSDFFSTIPPQVLRYYRVESEDVFN